MPYTLVHVPEIDRSAINAFRGAYDPYVDALDAHITLVFATPEVVGEEAFIAHCGMVLAGWQPFDIHLYGLARSWDNWLFLTLQEGRSDVIRLSQALYTGLLAPYYRPDIPMEPHISLGLFTQAGAGYDLRAPSVVAFDAPRYEQALREAETLHLDYRCRATRMLVVRLTDDLKGGTPLCELPLA